MTKEQKESILLANKLLLLAKDDEERLPTYRKYLHSKISEVMQSKRDLDLRSTKS